MKEGPESQGTVRSTEWFLSLVLECLLNVHKVASRDKPSEGSEAWNQHRAARLQNENRDVRTRVPIHPSGKISVIMIVVVVVRMAEVEEEEVRGG